MSDPVTGTPAPNAPEPRPEPATSSGTTPDQDGADQAVRKKRRGSRGGRGRKPGGNNGSLNGDDGAPDRPLPHLGAAGGTDGGNGDRPRIGDTRPARVIPPPPGPRPGTATAPEANGAVSATGGEGKKKRR